MHPSHQYRPEIPGHSSYPAREDITPTAAEPVTTDLAPVLAHFDEMIGRCYEYAKAARAAGRPIVGILCEFTPRELILAANAVPVCLCGGSPETIPPAEQHLPTNLCPLIKSTFGYHLTGKNPFLEWADLVVAETTCDGKKKMFEILATSRPLYVLALPHQENDPDALEFWTREVRKLKSQLECQFKVTITDSDLRRAIGVMNRERTLRRRLAQLMTRHPPPLTGLQLLKLKSIISGLDADFDQYQHALRILSSHLGPHRSPKTNPVRVLLTGVPLVHGAERVLKLIEECGSVVVAMENCTGLKPVLEDVDETHPDPLAAIADKYYHLPCSVMTPNSRRRALLRSLAATYHPDCIIELVWQACLTYDLESYHIRKLAQEELHLPYLKITTDYSPSDSARITTRVTALFETVRDGSRS